MLPYDLSHHACDVPTPPVNRQTPVKTLPSQAVITWGFDNFARVDPKLKTSMFPDWLIKPLNHVSFLYIFGGHQFFLWGHWYPRFGLLVTSPLSFKARVGSLNSTWWRHMCYMFPEIYLWCNTCSPPGSRHGSQADLFYEPVSRHWWGSKPGPITP